MMEGETTTTVTQKGQVTIPRIYRKRYSIKEGVKVRFVPMDQVGANEMEKYALALQLIPHYDSFIGVDQGKGSYEAVVKELEAFRRKWEAPRE
jgi:bifunctional DNA-binding transcriptional regulator/antitoxin component of YhaV-PrlF toxin-antitoxin module